MSDNLTERARELLPDESELERFAIIKQMADRIDELETAEFVGRLPDYVKELETERDEAHDRIDELESALREIGQLECGREIACSQSEGEILCCGCISDEVLRIEP